MHGKKGFNSPVIVSNCLKVVIYVVHYNPTSESGLTCHDVMTHGTDVIITGPHVTIRPEVNNDGQQPPGVAIIIVSVIMAQYIQS